MTEPEMKAAAIRPTVSDAKPSQQARSGARLLVDALVGQGVSTAYCVPGESYLAVLDALYDSRGIRTVVCRHEGAAANMADAYGKLTGRPGICFVTRGPGATHASVGLHTAFQDSTPMILFIGQVARGCAEREAFQEIDYRRMFGSVAKWVAEIDSAARVPEYVARAFSTAVAGRPGPVVLALPEDMLTDAASVHDAPRHQVVQAAPNPHDISLVKEYFERAHKPVVVLGGATWTQQARDDLTAFTVANRLPVAVSFRSQGLYDHRNENYIGDVGLGINPKLAQRIRQADLIVALGTRLGEATTAGYTLIDVPKPRQTMVHAYPGAEELGRVYQADLQINTGMPAFAASLKSVSLAPLAPKAARDAWLADAREDYLRHTTPSPDHGRGVDLAHVMAFLNGALPDDSIITNGAGNYTVWVHRYYRHRGFRTQLAPTSGAMGYGLPAAIAAKLEHPGRTVVAFAGDGCFLMYGQELATAAQYNAAVIVIVVNNGTYGTIRMHQERHFPGRVSATTLRNPDFVMFAKSFGAHAECVERTEDFAGAFERARQAGRLALLELKTDREIITPSATLSGIRASALRALAAN
jgi:acetolactate synthase-1/2/3 large subunit